MQSATPRFEKWEQKTVALSAMHENMHILISRAPTQDSWRNLLGSGESAGQQASRAADPWIQPAARAGLDGMH